MPILMGVVVLAVQDSMQIERVMSVELSVWQAVWVRLPTTFDAWKVFSEIQKLYLDLSLVCL
jgi:hypothetical protein